MTGPPNASPTPTEPRSAGVVSCGGREARRSPARARTASRPLAPLALAPLLLALAACGDTPRRGWPTGVLRSRGAGAPMAEDGPWTYWYFDGQMRARGTYADGLRTGLWETWHRNGQRASRGERRPDRASGTAPRQGPWTFWHETGYLLSEGAFRDGRREGPWTFWHDDGRPDDRKTGRYEDGVRVGPLTD